MGGHGPFRGLDAPLALLRFIPWPPEGGTDACKTPPPNSTWVANRSYVMRSTTGWESSPERTGVRKRAGNQPLGDQAGVISWNAVSWERGRGTSPRWRRYGTVELLRPDFRTTWQDFFQQAGKMQRADARTRRSLTGRRGLTPRNSAFTRPVGASDEMMHPIRHSVREQIQEAEFYTHQSGTNSRRSIAGLWLREPCWFLLWTTVSPSRDSIASLRTVTCSSSQSHVSRPTRPAQKTSKFRPRRRWDDSR